MARPKNKKAVTRRKAKAKPVVKPRENKIGDALLSARRLTGDSGLATHDMRVTSINNLVSRSELTRIEGRICLKRILETDRQHLIEKLTAEIENRVQRTRPDQLRNAFKRDLLKRITRYKFLGKKNCSVAIHVALENVASKTNLETSRMLYDESGAILNTVFKPKTK